MPSADSKQSIKVECSYIPSEGLEEQKYSDFLQKCYGHDCAAFRISRMRHFAALDDFRCCIASVDNQYVGQSCAYKTYAIAHGERHEFWWSIDTIVLPESRGMGVGKKLQGKLHSDLPNFSSAWYSPINGIIKKRCGAHGLFGIHMAYYPVSRFFSIISHLLCLKFLKRRMTFIPKLPFLYSTLNFLFKRKDKKQYTVQEVSHADLGKDDFAFIAQSLRQYDFYIERSPRFLHWQYKEMMHGVHLFRILKDEKQCGFVACSSVHNSSFYGVPISAVSIYELLTDPDSSLSRKGAMSLITNVFRSRNEYFDGFLSTVDVNYLGKLYYPLSYRSVLSTLPGEYINPYFTYADQDLDQL